MLSAVSVMWANKIVATVCVSLVALLGDHVVAHDTLFEDIRAVADNLTHGTIGLLTWHIVTTHLADLSFTARLSEVLLCGLLASAIDLDHFAAARSLRIQDARQLPSRPPLHCTSVMLAVCGVLLLLSFTFRWLLLHRLSWILIAAVLSHHLRDAARRGLWLYPYGSSPPIPYAGYMKDFELEIFALVTGCFSVLAVVILAIVVIHLYSSIKKLKRQVALQTGKDLHSFHNPTIQPDEELAKRGFSMYKGQQEVRAPNTPEKEEYFGNFSPQPHQMARRY